MSVRRNVFLLVLIFSSLSTSIFFTNCAKGGGGETETSKEKVLGLSSVNYFREPVPDRFCGEEGFGYLLRSYLGPECGTCHSMGGNMFPPFGDLNDPANAFKWTKTLGKQNLIDKSVDNRFCGPDCNLDSRGEVYKALVEWLDHTDNCN
jgi:hypothetical protein